MPRGVQKSIEDRISAIQDEINEMTERRDNIQAKIDELEAKMQSLLDEQEAKKLKEIQKLISQSGKSPEEILDMLKTAV